MSITVSDVPARTVLGQLLVPLFPPAARWQLVEHEGTVADNDRFRVRITQRSISHSDSGRSADHLVSFAVTVTVPTETLDGAEAQLDDDLDAFLHALDAADVPWTTATKGRYGDEGNRLGYQLDITIRTNPQED